MKINPDSQEIEVAAKLLVDKYNVSSRLLGQLFGIAARDQANLILRNLGDPGLHRKEIAKLLILKEGSSLFSGSTEPVKKLRHHLLKNLPERKIKQLFNKHASENNLINTTSYMITPLVDKTWRSGGRWPRDFVKALGFPPIFAGVKQHNSNATFVDVQPIPPVPKLVKFQEGLKERMLEVLERDRNKTRCVVTLPTGGGKTRVAVEAFIDWMMPRFDKGKYLIWIAQSEELCEQAIKCIEQMWSSKEFPRPLRIYRYFGGRNIPEEELVGGVIVSSIHQLHHRLKSGDPVLDNILEDAGAMIIDEAHRAVSDMYNGLLRRAEEINGTDAFPICGLTATPGRAGLEGNDETRKLVNQFDAYLIQPDLGHKYSQDPLRYFREHNFLAKANHITYHSGKEYTLTDKELEQINPDPYEKLPPAFLKKLASDHSRNMLIIKRLLELPSDTPTLVYACTVDHAHLISVILTEKGRPAGVISHDTPATIRRGLIRDFKDGKLEFLCNFGVLTTGFDAPATKCIAICRPTTSEILYEQIIGRGLRGPRFGGTEECTIVDFADNINRLGKSLAYARFSDFWTSDQEENYESDRAIG